MKLSDIAEVRTGLVLSRKAAEIDSDVVAEYKQLNLKCIKETGEIDLQALDKFRSSEKLGNNYLTHQEDVIVRLTVPYTAVLINEQTQGLVVSSHFCMIRAKKNKAVPEFIQWLLNSQPVKVEIEKNKTGVSFAGIKPSFYSELEIEPLALEKQLKIAQVYSTALKELALLEDLKRQKDLFYKNVLKDIYHRKCDKRSMRHDHTRCHK